MISALKVRKLRVGENKKFVQAHKVNPEFTPALTKSHLLLRLTNELYKKEFYIENGIFHLKKNLHSFRESKRDNQKVRST